MHSLEKRLFRQRYHKTVLFFFIIFLFTACSDNATVVEYKKDSTPLKCLRLTVFPPDKLLSETLTRLYDFQEKCPYELQASRKSGIVCNSNQNADKKALSSFPSGFIRLDVYKAKQPIYSYYKDLTCEASQKDIKKAFKQLYKDLLL